MATSSRLKPGSDSDIVELSCGCGASFFAQREEVRNAADSDRLLTCPSCSVSSRSKDKRTAADWLLLAADELEPVFHISKVVVAAWKLCPERFGLPFHRDLYPDSNRVIVELTGTGRTILKLKLIERCGSSLYRVTSSGRERAKQLREADK